jgi:2-polyprenyl-3-methyl-5-hydroxy-6-metoxy-1,4-benzoquinol methylase
MPEGRSGVYDTIRPAQAGDADGVAALAAELAQSFPFSPERFRVNFPALLAADGACLLLAARWDMKNPPPISARCRRRYEETAMRSWTNEEAIQRWAVFPREVLDAMEPDGDFCRRHLLNPALLRMLGDVRGQRILDAGCGHGYLSRLLAVRGARVTGVEPAQALYDYATEKEAGQSRGIRYVQADLCELPDLGGPFDAVVASMVLLDIPDWAAAMRACVAALAPGGLFVFSVIHPCFEQLAPSWGTHGEYRIGEYFAEYEIPGPYASSFHRPLSAYLNELARLDCHLSETAEPALDPATAAAAGRDAQAYVHLPNFLVVAARRALPAAIGTGPATA